MEKIKEMWANHKGKIIVGVVLIVAVIVWFKKKK
mgnify:CR=1 FL=1